MVRVKICGITNIEDARLAVRAGADALGFVFAPSPRRISPETAAGIIASLPLFVSTVGVFVNERAARIREIAAQCRLGWIQFHGDEGPEECAEFGGRAIKAVRVKDSDSLRGLDRYRVGAILLDSHVPGARGGTGIVFSWELAAALPTATPVILSGGLTVENVARAIAAATPYAVDVSSGVESEPGRKDPALMEEFVSRAKGTCAGDRRAGGGER
ncbi:MAG: phosphoribosylanthranilate isomerase [Chlamydiota bacterium]